MGARRVALVFDGIYFDASTVDARSVDFHSFTQAWGNDFGVQCQAKTMDGEVCDIAAGGPPMGFTGPAAEHVGERLAATIFPLVENSEAGEPIAPIASDSTCLLIALYALMSDPALHAMGDGPHTYRSVMDHTSVYVTAFYINA